MFRSLRSLNMTLLPPNHLRAGAPDAIIEPMSDTIVVLDYGSQYAQLIARRVRELQVYCELFHWNTPPEEILALQPRGFILSGGPNSVYDPGAPALPDYVLASGVPVLGICYGMQLLTYALGGKVAAGGCREYGHAQVNVAADNPLMPAGEYKVWMSHGDRVEQLPPGFSLLGSSANSPWAVMGDPQRRLYGIQFHPEVHHTPRGSEVLKNFAVSICGAAQDWTPAHIIEQSVASIRRQVGGARVLAAVSGGVDSTVAAALLHRAVGDQLCALFVDNGLLRQGERASVEAALQPRLGAALHVLDARDDFLAALRGVTDPEAKRRAVGEVFIRKFEAFARAQDGIAFLMQGTIYPDIIESRAPERSAAQVIKSHHNVGGLPKDMQFALVEPLRYLFKDEVRRIGAALELPDELIWRQPFPGPGLSVRCLGEVTAERLAALRAADAIYTSELRAAGLLEQLGGSETDIAQAFAALLPVKSVGVMGDQRTYQETVVLRAVSSQDFMTADWVRLPYDLLARVSGRIVNEVKGVNRVVYDLTSKPPATIEWE
jgi:GMP synthase (glutamine-hydrolysing)